MAADIMLKPPIPAKPGRNSYKEKLLTPPAEVDTKEPDLNVIPRLWSDIPDPVEEGNLRELAIAQQQLQAMFALLERQRIGNNRFHGKIHMVIPFQDGVAQRVEAAPEFRNR